MAEVLVVYASWTGATRTVAEAIGATLRGTGTDVTVSRAGNVKDPNPYDAVIDEAEENRIAAGDYVNKMRNLAPDIEPVGEVALFGGTVLADTPEFKRLFPLLKVPVKAMSQQPDHRDWEAIYAWTESVTPMLLPGDQ